MATIRLVEKLSTAKDAVRALASVVRFTDRSIGDLSPLFGTPDRDLAGACIADVTPDTPVVVGAPLPAASNDLGWRLLEEQPIEFDMVERFGDGVSWSVRHEILRGASGDHYFQVHLFVYAADKNAWTSKDHLFSLFAGDPQAATVPLDEFQLQRGRIAWKLRLKDVGSVRRLDGMVCRTMPLRYGAFAVAMTTRDFSAGLDETVLRGFERWELIPSDWQKHLWSGFPMPFQIGCENRRPAGCVRPEHLEGLLGRAVTGGFQSFVVECKDLSWKTNAGAEGERSPYNAITLGVEKPRRGKPFAGFWMSFNVDIASDADTLVLGEDDRRERTLLRELKRDMEAALGTKLKISY